MFVAPGLLALNACYSYQEVEEFSEVPVDARVRLQLSKTTSGSEEDSITISPGRLQGRLLKVRADSLYLESEGSLEGTGYALYRAGADTIRVARAQVSQASVRKLSHTRTAVVAGGTALAVGGYIVLSFDASGGSRPGDNSPGGLEASLVPILSVPVP